MAGGFMYGNEDVSSHIDDQRDGDGRLIGYNVDRGYQNLSKAIQMGDYDTALFILEHHPEVRHYLSGKEERSLLGPLLEKYTNLDKKVRKMQDEVAISDALGLKPRTSVLLGGQE